MGAVAFLLLAAGIAVVGSFVLYLRHRQPTTPYSGIDDFRREMDALAPQNERRPLRRRRDG